MAVLLGTIVLAVLVVGTAALSGHPLVFIAAALVLATATLGLTGRLHRAAAALTCAVAGLFMFNVVFGPLAIGLGAVAAQRSPAPVSRRVGLAAVVLGVADLVVLAVLTLGRVHGGAFSWHV